LKEPATKRSDFAVSGLGVGFAGRTRDFLAAVGRVLFATIFVRGSFDHFSRPTIAYMSQQGVPFAPILVPAAGILALLGGLSLLAGYRARLGAALLVLFLVPVTLIMHRFWEPQDPLWAQVQFTMFLKNLGLLGGALLVMRVGAGPFSLDERQGR